MLRLGIIGTGWIADQFVDLLMQQKDGNYQLFIQEG